MKVIFKIINNYFLGEDSHWTDMSLLYGFYLTISFILLITMLGVSI